MRSDCYEQNRAASRNLRPLRRLIGFLRPYRGRIALAAAALIVAAAALLAFGVVIREVVDSGLYRDNLSALDDSLLLSSVAISVMAVTVGARVYLIGWLGGRVVGDLRKRCLHMSSPWTWVF